MSGCLDVWVYGCPHVWMSGCLDVWLSGCLDVYSVCELIWNYVVVSTTLSSSGGAAWLWDRDFSSGGG